MSLAKELKNLGKISTNIGQFEYISSLGEGGNSFVFHFKKADQSFAIKFLKNTETSKTNRFKDEFFCAAQIPSNENIARSYHFDKIEIKETSYLIIVMKFYDGTLSSEGDISKEDEEIKSEKAWKLFLCLANALHHLHSNKIIHRDIKPQNIFYEEATEKYVIGDLGIAHFSDEFFGRESKTTPSERMANFSFSAPEQVNSKNTAEPSCDIYSMGQTLHWYLTGKTIRGLEMAPLAHSESPKELTYLNSIVKKCLSNDPSKRFQSIAEINEHIKTLKKPKERDYWATLNAFDRSIRSSFPRIEETLAITDPKLMERFFNNFKKECKLDDFWYMTLEGGDNELTQIDKISESSYLFCHDTEITISKLLIHRDLHYPYKNFLIILTSPSPPFDLIDNDGTPLTREIDSDQELDYATLWNEKYIDYRDTKNGYYEFNDEIIPVDRDVFLDRQRHLIEYAYIVVPKGTATARMMDRTPTERFLGRTLNKKFIDKDSLETYKRETKDHHSIEITKYN